MRRLVIQLINIYQSTLSPDHSFWGKQRFPYGYCRFYPTCSEYAKLSVEKHGVFKGVLAGAYRVLRCNPLSAGGIDLIKAKKQDA